MRYIHQRDRFRCAAVAVVNAWKWLGKRATYDDVLRLSKRWGLSGRVDCGGSCAMVQKALGVKGRATEDELWVRKTVSAGHAVVIGNLTHVWFCPGFAYHEGQPVGYVGVNVFEGEEKQSLVSWADMRRLLRLGFVWVIKR